MTWDDRNKPLPADHASYIFDELINLGAHERNRAEFIHHQTTSVCTEYRFMGDLGFGGKFWRTVGNRSDGTWGEKWLVNQYAEDERGDDAERIARANAELDLMVLQYEREVQ